MHRLEHLECRTLFASYAAANVPELIAAIHAANASAEADTITLVPGATFTLTAVDNGRFGPTGLPSITEAGGGLTILGNGSTIERSSAAGTPVFRLFDVDINASLMLSHLTVRGGATPGFAWGSQALTTKGGGIYSDGALSLSNVIVEGNTVTGASPQGGAGGDALGGGIFSGGTLVMTNCVVRNNVAVGGRGDPGGSEGGFSRPALPGGNGHGGGIYIAQSYFVAAASIRDSIITSNTAQGGLGGDPSRRTSRSGKGIGGGIYIGITASNAFLDAFTVRNTKDNLADTSRDIFGRYSRIV
jgi:hypothetical protein